MPPRKSLFAFNIKMFKLCANVHLNEKMGILSRSVVYVSLMLAIIHEISIVIDLLMNAMGDFQKFCDGTPMVMAFFMVAYEFYSIVAQKGKIEKLLEEIETNIHYYQPSYGYLTYKKGLMGKAVDALDRLGLYNILFGVFCVVLWVIRPIITDSKSLPFGDAWFPFDYQKYFYYMLVFHGYVGTCAAVNTINIHIFYSKVMAVICEQFDILSHAFQHIDENVSAIGESKMEEEIFQRGIKLVKYHQKLLTSCEELQRCLGGILACQFCFGISLCFAALATFSISAFSPTFINLLNHIFLEISELYIYCWFSNKLTEHSENVKEGVFYSKWYVHSAKLKKLMNIVIMRCKKPVVLRAANTLPVSVGSYIWILQQAYSFFMVLRQVKSKSSLH